MRLSAVVVALSGKSDKYPSFTEACGWGKGGGIGGWNCRHHIYAYVEGISKLPEPIDEKENKRVEELNKKQRRLESAIRLKKRELLGLKEGMEVTDNDKLKFELQQRYDRSAYQLRELNKKYTDFCSDNGLKTWNERKKVVNFQREQSYEARIGADRYKTNVKQSGGRKTVDYKNWSEYKKEQQRRDNHAIKYYESVRNSNKEMIVGAIAENTQFSKAYIEKVIDHIFFKEYNLCNGYGRFTPDYEIAESIRRLREGKHILKHDIILLKHEHLEYGLMNKLNMSSPEAHDATNRKYNYQQAVEAYEKELIENGKGS